MDTLRATRLETAAARGQNAPLLGCDQPIDRDGTIAHNELRLTGWAASAHGISGVVVQIDDRLLHASYGLDSPWIAESLPDVQGADHAGYDLRLDTSAWRPGTYGVTIVAFDADARRGELAGSVEVLPFERPRYTTADNLATIADGGVAMWLDAPRIAEGSCEVTGALEVAGWAHASAGVERVVVTVDRQSHHEALRPIVRPDLLDDYGAEIAGSAGFALRLHLRECPPGSHSLSVVAVGRDGQAVGIEGEVVCLADPGDPPPSSDGSIPIDWDEDRSRPQPRNAGDLASPHAIDETSTMWQDRALLAEADAAARRTEANLAQMHQRGSAELLRETEGRLGGELEAARADLAEAHARLEEQGALLAEHASRLSEQSGRLMAAEQATIDLQRSLSWRVTRPLRGAKGALRRIRAWPRRV